MVDQISKQIARKKKLEAEEFIRVGMRDRFPSKTKLDNALKKKKFTLVALGEAIFKSLSIAEQIKTDKPKTKFVYKYEVVKIEQTDKPAKDVPRLEIEVVPK